MELDNEIIEVVQNIGEEVCEGCGPDTDCGVDPEDCNRIEIAVSILDQYLKGYEKIYRCSICGYKYFNNLEATECCEQAEG